MASLISEAMTLWDDLIENKRDRRVDGWFMMGSPWPSFLLCVGYVYLVVSAGPRFMRDRQPYNIRNIMLVYNFAMVLLSGYCFLEFGLAGWFTGYSFGCQLVDFSNSPKALRMANVCWWFYFSKFIELLDTVFFVMRKKYSQVTFLHVFHHGIMPISWWFGVRFVPGGFGTFHALLNSWIHFMMYIYYGVSALGPQYQKYLWWKKYMTKMQITQFILVCIHSFQLLVIDCPYPKLFVVWIGLYAVIFLIMFANFYIKAYLKPKSKAKVDNNSNDAVSREKKAAVTNGFKKD